MSEKTTESILAQQALGDIHALRSLKAWERYFIAGVRRQIAECEKELRKRGISTDDHSFWCGKLDVLESLLTKLDVDEAANRNIAG